MNFVCGLVSLLLLGAARVNAETLTLDQYLDQVTHQNEDFESSRAKEQSVPDKIEEASLPYATNIFGEASALDDASPRSSILTGNRLINNTYAAGLSKQFEYGLNAKLYYQSGYTDISGLPSFPGLSLGLNAYYTAGWNLDLSLPLLKNGFGAQGRYAEQAQIAQQRATLYAQQYAQLATISSAESSYWDLALAQAAFKVRQDALDRAEEMVKLAGTDGGGDAGRGDRLQAQAALESRRLDFQTAESWVRDASLAFNVIRGQASEEVKDQLFLPDIASFNSFRLSDRAAMRLDTLAAKMGSEAGVAAAKAARENSKPDLQLYGRVSVGGLGESFGDTSADAFTSRHPMSQVGLRFSAPLDFVMTANIRRGYDLDAQAAELSYKQKTVQEQGEWLKLTRNFEELKTRLVTSVKAEGLQRDKLENEKRLQSSGRSTTFQIVQFEQDYLNAQASRLQLTSEALKVYARLKTFREVRSVRRE